VFCRNEAEAEKYVGLEVAEEDSWDDRGEWRGDGSNEVFRGVEVGIERGSKILSWDADRFSIGVEIALKKVGFEVVVRILSWE